MSCFRFLASNILDLIGFVFSSSLFIFIFHFDKIAHTFVKNVLDFFGTYTLIITATMLLGVFSGVDQGTKALIDFPMLFSSLFIIASVISMILVFIYRLFSKKHDWQKGMFLRWAVVSVLVTIILVVPAVYHLINNVAVGYKFLTVFYPILFGALTAALVPLVVVYYLGKKSNLIKRVSNIIKTSPLEAVCISMAMGLRSVFMFVVLISLLLWGAYAMLGFYGIALSAVAIVLFGNLIVKGHLNDCMIKNNKEKNYYLRIAQAQSYSVFLVSLSAMLVFAVYMKGLIELTGKFFIFDLANHQVLVGLLLGMLLVSLFSGYVISSNCGETASKAKVSFLFLMPFLFITFSQVFLGFRSIGGFVIGGMIASLFLLTTTIFSSSIWNGAKEHTKEEKEETNKVDLVLITTSLIRISAVLTLVLILFLS